MFLPVGTPNDRRKWMDELPPGQFRHLFDHLSGTLFFAKDIPMGLSVRRIEAGDIHPYLTI